MKDFTKKHAHKFLILWVLAGIFVIIGSYFIWNNRYIILRQQAARTAVVDINSPDSALPDTMIIKARTQVVWRNTTKQAVKLIVNLGSGQSAVIQPGDSYSIIFNQAGTVGYTLGNSQAQGSLIVQ